MALLRHAGGSGGKKQQSHDRVNHPPMV
jgi:hypothetical protein